VATSTPAATRDTSRTLLLAHAAALAFVAVRSLAGEGHEAKRPSRVAVL
jgi:hypothetical protein